MLDYSYPNIYQGYVKFCKAVDVVPLSFEDWMVKREGITIQDDAKDFINSRPPVGGLTQSSRTL